ncbi:histone-lysine N-methyltransferase SETMAR [Trichonephila clavipes]|nr:histone-lysine N-methyltransferase SETMAR [Trichonephila clavipes]
MQDGAPPHITRCVTDVPKHHFTEERVISRQFRHLWPPRSPDLNPCDFWLWGHLKQLVAEIVHGVYGADTVIANYVQFWFRRFRSGIFDVKDARHTGRPIVENVNKIAEIIKVDRYVSSRSIAQNLTMDHKIVLSHLHKDGFKKKLHVWVPLQLTPKNMMDRISICEVLVKRNEIDPFLKRMVTGDEKWVI